MTVHIDRDRCEGHGQCVAAAPDLIDLDDDGIAILRTSGPLSGDLAGQGAAAAEVCPLAAITLDT